MNFSWLFIKSKNKHEDNDTVGVCFVGDLK